MPAEKEAGSGERAQLAGPPAECAKATHVVSKLYVGGFAMVAGEASSLEAKVKVFGAGAGDTEGTSMERIDNAGDAKACEEARTTKKETEGCQVPRRIGLLALEDATPSSTFRTSIFRGRCAAKPSKGSGRTGAAATRAAGRLRSRLTSPFRPPRTFLALATTRNSSCVTSRANDREDPWRGPDPRRPGATEQAVAPDGARSLAQLGSAPAAERPGVRRAGRGCRREPDKRTVVARSQCRHQPSAEPGPCVVLRHAGHMASGPDAARRALRGRAVAMRLPRGRRSGKGKAWPSPT